MSAARVKVGDRVQMRRAPLLPGEHDVDTGTMLGTVVKVIDNRGRGLSAGASNARVRWDNGHEGRAGLGMLRVVDLIPRAEG